MFSRGDAIRHHARSDWIYSGRSEKLATQLGAVMNDPQMKIFPVRRMEPELRKSLPAWFRGEFGNTGFT
jgi:hypothetical protein